VHVVVIFLKDLRWYSPPLKIKPTGCLLPIGRVVLKILKNHIVLQETFIF
jgi:hypothetical protein